MARAARKQGAAPLATAPSDTQLALQIAAPLPDSHQALLRTLAGQRGNSWLLTGPQRVGKRLLALHAAQLQNCQQPVQGSACGRCASCHAAALGVHPDVLLLQPRTQTATGKVARRKVIPVGAVLASRDTGRDYEQHVYEFLEIRPTYRRRVVVIEGAEYLNEHAANALLKLIEEPPHQALFFLLSEDVRAVLPTLVSRSGRLRAPPLTDAEILALAASMSIALSAEEVAFVAGRAGFLPQAEQVRAALGGAHALMDAVQESLWATFEQAKILEETFDPVLGPEALRFVWREWPPQPRTLLDSALAELEGALEAYANPALSMQVFALRVRGALV